MTESEIKSYAARFYNDVASDTRIFLQDFSKIRHLIRYLGEEDKRCRLILNTVIILNNVFDPRALSVILFHSVPESTHLELNTYLKYLNINVQEITDYDTVLSDKLIFDI